MKQNRNQDDLFQLLENADDETIFHLAENYIAADKDEMENIFNKSEKKYKIRTNLQSDAIETEELSEYSRNFGLIRYIISFAACLTLTFCAINGVMKLRPVSPHDMGADAPETVGTQAELKISEESVSVPAETVLVYVTETALFPESQTETAQFSESQTETIQILEVDTETTAFVLPESEQEFIEPTEPDFPLEVIPIQESLAEITETEELSATDFVETTEFLASETETAEETSTFDFFPETRINENNYSYDCMSVIPDENAPETIIRQYLPQWLPEGYVLEQTIENNMPQSFSVSYQNESGQSFTFHQQLQQNFTGLLPEDISEIIYTNINQNPAYYFTVDNEIECCYLYWKQDGYLFTLETYQLSVEDSLKIAESVQ